LPSPLPPSLLSEQWRSPQVLLWHIGVTMSGTVTTTAMIPPVGDIGTRTNITTKITGVTATMTMITTTIMITTIIMSMVATTITTMITTERS
jgi:hypothetical protein